MSNERGRIHEHKAPFPKQLSAQAFASPCERRVQNRHMVTLKRATRSIRCSSAGGFQTALHYCRRPLLDWGWIACIRRKASCTEPRGPYRDCSVRIHVPCHPLYLYICIGTYVRTYIHTYIHTHTHTHFMCLFSTNQNGILGRIRLPHGYLLKGEELTCLYLPN